jgi:hypothetical protein
LKAREIVKMVTVVERNKEKIDMRCEPGQTALARGLNLLDVDGLRAAVAFFLLELDFVAFGDVFAFRQL